MSADFFLPAFEILFSSFPFFVTVSLLYRLPVSIPVVSWLRFLS